MKSTVYNLSVHSGFDNGQVKPFAPHDAFHRYTFDHHDQFWPFHRKRVLFFIVGGTFKAARLQTFMVDDQPTVFPVKKFYGIARTVHENEDLAAQRVPAHP